MRRSVYRLLAVFSCISLMPYLRAQTKLPVTEEVVDHSSFKLKGKDESSHVALTVDKDDNVKLYGWFEHSDHTQSDFRVLEYIGRRILQSGSLSLSGLVSKREVPAIALRVASSDQSVFHVVLTWGLNRETPEPLEPWYNLYVFAQSPETNGVRQVYAEPNINLQLFYLQVRNLGGSGLAEIIDIGSEDRGQTANVRLLTKDGHVQLLQRIEGDDISLIGDRFVGSYILRIENSRPANKPLKPDDPCTLVRILKWSSEVNRFVESGH